MADLYTFIKEYIRKEGEAKWNDTDVVIVSRGADFMHRVLGKGHRVPQADAKAVKEQDATFIQVCELLKGPLNAGSEVLFLGFGSSANWQLKDGRQHISTTAPLNGPRSSAAEQSLL